MTNDWVSVATQPPTAEDEADGSVTTVLLWLANPGKSRLPVMVANSIWAAAHTDQFTHWMRVKPPTGA